MRHALCFPQTRRPGVRRVRSERGSGRFRVELGGPADAATRPWRRRATACPEVSTMSRMATISAIMATPSISAAAIIIVVRMSLAASGWRAVPSMAELAKRPMPSAAPSDAPAIPMPAARYANAALPISVYVMVWCRKSTLGGWYCTCRGSETALAAGVKGSLIGRAPKPRGSFP